MTKLDIYSSRLLIRQRNDVWVNKCIDNTDLSHEELVQLSRTYLNEPMMINLIEKRKLPTSIVNFLSFWGNKEIFDSLLKYQHLEIYSILQIHYYGTDEQRKILKKKYKYQVPREKIFYGD